MKKFLLIICSAALLVSCGKNQTPDNVIQKTEITANGFRPDGIGRPPVEVMDTNYTLKPTWGQANYIASLRNDHTTYNVIGGLAITVFLVAMILIALGFINIKGMALGGLFLVCIGGGILSMKWQALGVKWDNSIKVKKSVYDEAMKTGSTKPIWDDFISNHRIIDGDYK